MPARPPAPRVAAALALLVSTLREDRRRVVALVALLLAGTLLPLGGPLLVGLVVDGALDGRPLDDLTLLAVAYLGLAVGAEALALVLTWQSAHVAWSAGNRLREQLAEHAVGLDLAWHGRHSAGELISRIDGDVDALTTFFANVVVRVVANVVLVAGVAVVVLVVDWRVGLVISASATLGLVAMVRLRSLAVEAHADEREASSALYGDLEERLGGLEDLRANGAGNYAVRRLHERSTVLWRATRRAWTRGNVGYAASAGAFAVGTVATLGLGTWLHRRGELSIGMVLALFRYLQLLRHPLDRIAEQLPELQKALAAATRAQWLLGQRTTIDEPAEPTPLPAGPLALDLDHVALTYDAIDGPALRDIDLHVAAGRTVGVVGRTGSGKTSLGRLLLRLWDPTAGTVCLGGVDLRDAATSDLRRRVAVVTQDVEVFRATVRDNLTLFGQVPADDDRLRVLLDDVGLGPWLASRPDGLDDELEGSGGLSAGEAQLLAMARAFLTDPGLVVLDEASSRLDPDTEARLAAATTRLLAGRTAVVIAHRLATLDALDELVVVDAGRVVEHGPRDVLAADPASRYARLLAAHETAEVLV